MSNTWEQKLIEDVLLAHVKEQRRSRRWGIFFKLVGFALIVYLILNPFLQNVTHNKLPHVALINIEGGIFAGDLASADNIVTSLREAFEEPNAKAVILRINSPGGSPVQAGYIYDEMMRLRKIHVDKKIYSVIVDLGASAAYYLASASDFIYADKASLVGSIGTLMPGFGVVELAKKVGVEQRSQFSGAHKLILDPFSPVDPADRAFVQKLLDVTHQQFIDAVKVGRGNRLKNDPEIFSGLFWTGAQAVDLGLVDALGSASFVARDVVGIGEIYDYTLTPTWIERVGHKIGAQFRHQLQQWSVVSWD